MADGQAKKLNLPLYLNPVVSRPDQVAMTALEQWYARTKKSCGGTGSELEGVIRAFHRDLYLAGLHLYLINPRLCRHVAEALQQPNPSVEVLSTELQGCGLWPTAEQAPGSDGFSNTQLEQLQSLLAEVKPEPSVTAASGGESPELLKQLGSMEAELRQLRSLVEEQSRQLRQLKVAAPAESAKLEVSREDGTEEMDVSGMAGQMEKIQEIRKKGVF